MDAEIITNLRTAARDAGGEGTWHLAMLDGTRAPMYGEIQSTDDTFRYDYHGVPDEFRIVLATKDGARLSRAAALPAVAGIYLRLRREHGPDQ